MFLGVSLPGLFRTSFPRGDGQALGQGLMQARAQDISPWVLYSSLETVMKFRVNRDPSANFMGFASVTHSFHHGERGPQAVLGMCTQLIEGT